MTSPLESLNWFLTLWGLLTVMLAGFFVWERMFGEERS